MSSGVLLDSTLGEICNLVTDGTHDTPKPQSDGYPLIKAKEIVSGIIDFMNCDFISETEHLKVISRSKPEKGDTLFTHIGASLGEAAFVNTSREFSIKNIALFKPNPRIINGRYLYYLVISPQFQELAKSARTGSAQPFLSLGHLRSHRVRFHENIDDQKNIAAILSAFDDLIENNLRRIKILEEMAQNLYREWFVRFRFPGHQNVEMVDSPLGKIPEGWEVKRLAEVIELAYGKGLREQDRIPGNVPVYGSSGVVGYHNQSLVESPGIIVGRKGNVGSIHWTDSPFFPIDTVFYVITELPLYYVYFNLQTQNFISGDAAVPGLNRNQAYSLPFILPTLNVLQFFSQTIEPIFHLLNLLKRKNDVLRRTRDFLLPKLISGEVDVSELDITIPEANA